MTYVLKHPVATVGRITSRETRMEAGSPVRSVVVM